MLYANEFSEIADAVKSNENLRQRILDLIMSEPIPSKALEGDGRTEVLRSILSAFFCAELNLNQAISFVKKLLPRQQSQYADNNRVFAKSWEERLLRTNISCFYNQAVLMEILESGHSACFVDHSSSEHEESNCTRFLAGECHDATQLLQQLVETYRKGHWNKDFKIPEHPYCSHTVQPIHH